MRPLSKCRLIPFNKLSCFDNMAIDEYLISRFREDGMPVLRLYGWSVPSISLGRYQRAGEVLNIDLCLADRVPVVRRITGGGAIYHKEELTYSFVCSADFLNGKNLSVKESFERLNTFIIHSYRALGLNASFAGDIFRERKLGQRASFCFSDNEECDIIIKGKKIGGNAQKREGDLIFQHGSLPFSVETERIKKYFKDPIDFENYSSLSGVSGRSITIAELGEFFSQSFKDFFKYEIYEKDLDEYEIGNINVLKKCKYNTKEWNMEGLVLT